MRTADRRPRARGDRGRAVCRPGAVLPGLQLNGLDLVLPKSQTLAILESSSAGGSKSEFWGPADTVIARRHGPGSRACAQKGRGPGAGEAPSLCALCARPAWAPVPRDWVSGAEAPRVQAPASKRVHSKFAKRPWTGFRQRDGPEIRVSAGGAPPGRLSGGAVP